MKCKAHKKIPLNPFCIGQLLLGTGLPWSVVHILREMTMDKMIAFLVRVGTLSTSPASAAKLFSGCKMTL